MSKAGNIRRAKLLRQRKKEREKKTFTGSKLQQDQQFLREKAENENVKIIDRALTGKKEKISTVLLEMIKPILLTVQDEEDAKGIVSMGVVAWNCGIIKQTLGEEQLRDAMKAFKSGENSWERNLLNEYIGIKCTRYGQYNDYIIDFKVSFERDGRMNFTVMTDISKDHEKTFDS